MRAGVRAVARIQPSSSCASLLSVPWTNHFSAARLPCIGKIKGGKCACSTIADGACVVRTMHALQVRNFCKRLFRPFDVNWPKNKEQKIKICKNLRLGQQTSFPSLHASYSAQSSLFRQQKKEKQVSNQQLERACCESTRVSCRD